MSLLQRLRERFWFVPAALCLLAFAVAEGLVALDERMGVPALPGWAESLLYRVGESGSRDILGAIATSSLAVAGTTFSITMAVLALTSSSYGPRLVRNFMADRGNQVVLGVYVSTFLYCLLVLRSIRAIGDPGDPEAEVFVPHLAVNGAVLLAMADVAVLVYFIHHISDSIQISTLAGGVRSDLLAVVDRLYPAGIGTPGPPAAGPDLPARLEAEGTVVTAARPGYVQSVADDALLRTARAGDVLVALRVRPGQRVLPGTVLAVVHPAGHVDDRLRERVREHIRVADARSPVQDVEFSVQQLTEMAVRALSPGTNDPYTAVNALDDLTAGLSTLVARPVPAAARLDDDGVLRVHAVPVDVPDLVSGVVDRIRWYGADHPGVMHAALELVREVGTAAHDAEVGQRLVREVGLLRDAFASAGHHPHDRAVLDAQARAVLTALAGRLGG